MPKKPSCKLSGKGSRLAWIVQPLWHLFTCHDGVVVFSAPLVIRLVMKLVMRLVCDGWSHGLLTVSGWLCYKGSAC